MTNAIPFAESFEQYADNTYIKGTSGWYSSAYDQSSVTNSPLPSSVTDFPIQTNHTRYGKLNTEGAWLVNAITGGQQHVWIDMLLGFRLCEDPPPTDGSPQLVLWVNTRSNLCVFAQKPDTGVASMISSTRRVMPNSGDSPFLSRLSVHLAYLAAPTGACFAVFLDSTAVDWPGGERLPGLAGTIGVGPWLRCPPASGSTFPGLAFGGTGLIDDLVVTDGYPLTPSNLTVRLADGVSALTWQSDFGRTYQAETCTNLVTSDWQPLGAPVVGTGLTNTLPVSTSDFPTRFFRVFSPAP